MTPLIIVFVHGLFGWGEVRDRRRWPKDYWNGVRGFFEKEFGSRRDLNLKFFAPSLPSVDSIEARGATLKDAIEGILKQCQPGTKVHLIAHSRGGMDARWVIAQPGMADKIASLTTIGTAHRGTTFMSWAYGLLPLFHFGGKLLKLIEDLKRRFGMRSSEFYYHFLQGYDSSHEQMKQALYPLTFKGASEFSASLSEQERVVRTRAENPVVYRAYGGRVARARLSFLKPSHMIMAWFGTRGERRSGNDGATSVWSAHYPWENDDGMPEYVETVPFDHYEQVNWNVPDWQSIDSLPAGLQVLYRNIMKDILAVHDADRPSLR
jgi:triacylglycerol esterase/lipase EstA (alpha/beta hydrolase family)